MDENKVMNVISFLTLIPLAFSVIEGKWNLTIFILFSVFIWFIAIKFSSDFDKEESQKKDNNQTNNTNNKGDNKHNDKDSKKTESQKSDEDYLDDLDFYSLSARLLVVINRIGKANNNDLTTIKEYINQSSWSDSVRERIFQEIEEYVKKGEFHSITLLAKKIRQSKEASYQKLSALFEYILIIVYSNGIYKDFTELESISKRLGIPDYYFRDKKKKYDKMYYYAQKEKEKREKKEKKEKKKEKEKNTYNENKDKYVELTLTLMVEAMKVDRSKMVCELDVIKEFISQNDNANFSKRVQEVKELLKGDYDKENVTQICQRIKNLYQNSYSKREEILKAVISVVYADETCTPFELEFLKTVAFELQVSRNNLTFIRLSYENRKKREEENRKRKEEVNSRRMEKKKREEEARRERERKNQNNYQSNNSHSNSSSSSYTSELEKAYAALGIDKKATDKEIKASWRNLMRVNHPDLVASKGSAAVESATRKCQEINKAFEVIKASRGIK